MRIEESDIGNLYIFSSIISVFCGWFNKNYHGLVIKSFFDGPLIKAPNNNYKTQIPQIHGPQVRLQHVYWKSEFKLETVAQQKVNKFENINKTNADNIPL